MKSKKHLVVAILSFALAYADHSYSADCGFKQLPGESYKRFVCERTPEQQKLEQEFTSNIGKYSIDHTKEDFSGIDIREYLGGGTVDYQNNVNEALWELKLNSIIIRQYNY